MTASIQAKARELFASAKTHDDRAIAVAQGTAPLVGRGVIQVEGDRYRVRNRHVLRYYARTLKHLLHEGEPTGLTH